MQLRNAEFIVHYNNLWIKFDAAYKAVSNKPREWLENSLTRAGLQDDLDVWKQKTETTRKHAVRILPL